MPGIAYPAQHATECSASLPCLTVQTHAVDEKQEWPQHARKPKFLQGAYGHIALLASSALPTTPIKSMTNDST